MGGEDRQLCWNTGCPGWKINYVCMRTWEQNTGKKARIQNRKRKETLETGNERTTVQLRVSRELD